MNTANKSARSPEKSSARRPRVEGTVGAKPVSALGAKPLKATKAMKTAKRKASARQVKTNRGSSAAARKAVAAPVRLMLRARAVMADHGFRSISALQRSLAAIGVVISVPQLIRVVDGDAKHINKDVVEGMLTLFQCGVGDLLVMA